MTPRFRALRTCAALLALTAPALAASPHGTVPSYTASYAQPAPDASRAGSRAGEGRERPGRRESAPPDEAGDAATYEEVVPAPTAVPDEPQDAAAPVSGPVLPILPLGSGLILVGLGLGLAFLALRLRVRRA